MNKFKEIYRWLCSKKWFNKYILAIFIFLVILFFFDDSCLINRFKVHREIRKTKKEIIQIKNEIEKNTDFIDAITSNTNALEKFAREEYKMKKKNEDVYIIIEDE